MIKFVYFDVGGVVINDFTATNKWTELEKELGIHDTQEFIKFWDKYEPELCIGRNTESLIPLLKKQFDANLPDGYSLLIDGFIKRFEANKSIWPIINDFHKHCSAGLLTNMYPRMLSEIKKHDLLPNIAWDVIIDSSVEKLQKPDPRIFTLAEQKAGVSGNEILFIENTQRNITAAQKFGWQTYHYDAFKPEKSSQKLLQLFTKLRDN